MEHYLILQVMPLMCHSANSFFLLPSPVRVGVLFSKSKKCQELGLTTQSHSQKKNIYFFASFKEKTIFRNIFSSVFYHLHFIIRIFPSAFSHPHFPIRILSSAFCHPHFIIRILSSAFYYPPSAIRHPPPLGPQFTETLIKL